MSSHTMREICRALLSISEKARNVYHVTARTGSARSDDRPKLDSKPDPLIIHTSRNVAKRRGHGIAPKKGAPDRTDWMVL